ncbi:hypothetical protein ACFVYP_19965 [Kitasatospora sp. NPDC058201]|uniref:hypothetical protein n=1 Tax=unclassified Kitasatospora TaxID=2633591 RepID=UPI0036570856
MRTAPSRIWHARDLANERGITSYDSPYVQLGRWTREGILDEMANATCAFAADWHPTGPGRPVKDTS